jgi:hypothetical protein
VEWRREQTREVAEAEAVAMMESCPMFGGVALRDLDREDRIKRDTLAALFPGFCAVPDTARILASLAIEIIGLLFSSGVPNGSMGSSSGCRRLGIAYGLCASLRLLSATGDAEIGARVTMVVPGGP